MLDKKEQAKRDADSFWEKYDPEVAEFLADPKNIADMPPQLLAGYKVKSFEKDIPDKRLWIVKRRSDGAMGFSKYVRESDAHSSNRAKRETELLVELDHPAIPRVMDFWDCEKGSCLVRQYFEGAPLHIELNKRHKNGRGYFSVAEAFELALRIGEVLAYLGDQNLPVVHRDIKPQNIILTPEGEYKLVDFDVARRYDPTKLHDTTLVKSEGFAAPEQYGYRQSDPSADRYGLGATLLYMTTGTLDIESGLAQVEDKGLKYVIQKCCAFAPAERFSSANEMIRSIGYLQEGFVAIGADKAKVLGTTLESYRGESKKLWLMGITHISENAFREDVLYGHGYDYIEEIILSSNISFESIKQLKKLKSLTRIIIEGRHRSLIAYDGVLYYKYGHDIRDDVVRQIEIFPPKKEGTWIVPASISSLYLPAVTETINEIIVDSSNHYYKSIDGVLYEKAGYGLAEKQDGPALVYCPRGKKGIVVVADDTIHIASDAFHDCSKLTNVKIPLNFREQCIKWTDMDCELFEGCINLPKRLLHDWEVCEELNKYGLKQAKCTKCGDVRTAEDEYPPSFEKEKPSSHEAMLPPAHESVDTPSPTRFWNFTGRTITLGVDTEKLSRYRPMYDYNDDPWFFPEQEAVLHEIEWVADEEIHPGVTKGTVGGWLQQGAYLGDFAWIGKGVKVFDGGMVYGCAKVLGGAYIRRGTRVFDYATVDGTSLIGPNVSIYGHAHVTDGIVIGGNKGSDGYYYSDNPLHEVRIGGNARINGFPTILATEVGGARILGNSHITGRATIQGSVVIEGDAQVKGQQTRVGERARYSDHVGYRTEHGEDINFGFEGLGYPHLRGNIFVRDNARIYGHAKLEGNITVCGNAQIGGNARLKAADDTQPDKIVIGGDMKIIGDAIIEGSIIMENDKLVNHGRHIGTERAKGRVFYNTRKNFTELHVDDNGRLYTYQTEHVVDKEALKESWEEYEDARIYHDGHYLWDNPTISSQEVTRKILAGTVDANLVNFTREVFDEQHEKWVNVLSVDGIGDSLLFKLEFTASTLDDGEYLEIIIRDVLPDNLFFADNGDQEFLIGDNPFLPRVSRNFERPGENTEFSVNLVKDIDYVLTWNSVNFSITFTERMLKDILAVGDIIQVHYRATVDRDGLAASCQTSLASAATLTINRTKIMPTNE